MALPQPRSVFCRHGLASRQIRPVWVGHSCPALVAFDTYSLLNFKALQLARGCSRQVVLPDFITADSLGGSKLCRQTLYVESNHFSRVYDFSLSQRFEIRHNHGVQFLRPRGSFHSHHTDFFDKRRLQVMGLDFFGIDILAIGENDHVLLAPGDEQISALVDVTEVAGVQPAILEHFGCGVRTIPVALHHDRSANNDLATRGRAIIWSLRLDDFGFYSFQRFAHRANYVVVRRIDERAAACFREAVRLQNVYPQRRKVLRDLGVKSRSAGDQEPHALAEQIVNPAKEYPPRIESEPAAEYRGSLHQCKAGSGRRPALLDFLENPIMNEIEELRHHSESRNLAFAQRPQ